MRRHSRYHVAFAITKLLRYRVKSQRHHVSSPCRDHGPWHYRDTMLALQSLVYQITTLLFCRTRETRIYATAFESYIINNLCTSCWCYCTNPDKSYVIIHRLSARNCCSIRIDDPVKRSWSRAGSDPTFQMDIRFVKFSWSVRAFNLWCNCKHTV